MNGRSGNGSPAGTGRPLFLVWGPPSYGPRSRVLARELGIDIEFVYSTHRRGLHAAASKYSRQALATGRLLARRRPGLVLVQSPPSLAVLSVALYGAFAGARYIVDAHSDAFLSLWSRPRWLHRHLARRALATIVTNEHFADTIRSQGGQALVIRDVPASFPIGEAPTTDDGFNVLVVSTFAPDEPLAEVFAAAADLDEVSFHVTGNPARAPHDLIARRPANVHFTGFLPDEEYYALMRASQAVLCLTTRDHTMQRGACEALSLGRPIITSDWPLLRRYFHQGTVHVDNTAAGIRAGIARMREHHRTYQQEITALQSEQVREWETARRSIDALLSGKVGTSATAGGGS